MRLSCSAFEALDGGACSERFYRTRASSTQVREETDLTVGQDLSVAASCFTDLQSGSLVSLIKPVVPLSSSPLSNSCITLDLYRKRPGGQTRSSRTRRGP